MINRGTLLFTTLVILLFNLSCEETMKRRYELVLWAPRDNSMDFISEIENINDLKSKFLEHLRISDENVIKYYWDEQIMILKYDDLLSNGEFLACGVFTVLVDDKIVYWGFNNIGLTAVRDDSTEKREKYPSLDGYWIDKENRLYALVMSPNSKDNSKSFMEFPKEMQDILQRKEIYNIFIEKDKIVRGQL